MARQHEFPGQWLWLLPQSEFADDRQIAIPILIAQVSQQSGTLADHHQQAAPTGMVFLCVRRCSVNSVIRAVSNAICTSGEPVSVGCAEIGQ